MPGWWASGTDRDHPQCRSDVVARCFGKLSGRGVPCVRSVCPRCRGGDATHSVMETTTDAGIEWTREPIPGIKNVTTMLCASLDHCLVAGFSTVQPAVATVVVTDDEGEHWSQAALPSGSRAIWRGTCSSSADCAAVTTTGQFLSTTEGGDSWIAFDLPGTVRTSGVGFGVGCVTFEH